MVFPSTVAGKTGWTPEEAYRYCQRLAQTHYENFTVGSLLLPKEKRRHVYAIYAYCRSVDDLGDEATLQDVPGGEDEWPSEDIRPDNQFAHRLALLDWWQKELEACYSGAPTHPVMVALKETVHSFEIPDKPFLKLIEANRMDQRVQRYATYNDLLNYCDHSANPVGHLFLYLFGYREEQRQALSDDTCTALQLANFWQDVSRDYAKGRVYLLQEDLEQYGYTEAELAQGVFNDSFRQLLAFEVDRTREMFARGAQLVDLLDGPAKLDVALFTRGGVAILDAIRRQNYDVLKARPFLTRTKKAGLFLSTWLGWKLGLGMGLPTPQARG